MVFFQKCKSFSVIFAGAKMDSSSETSFNLKVFQLVEGSTGPSQLLDSRQIEYEEEGIMIKNFRVLTRKKIPCHF